jgi:transcriptional regulator with XRE-family HTH domain
MSEEKTSIKKDVGLRFCQFRRAINKTQQQLADELEIYQSTITNFEQGKTFPNINYLYYFNEKYGLDINWLITGAGGTFLRDYRLAGNASPSLEIPPHYHLREMKNHTELLSLMEIPIIEQVILAKFLELKTLLKNEIESFYLEKNREEKKEKRNGEEG